MKQNNVAYTQFESANRHSGKSIAYPTNNQFEAQNSGKTKDINQGSENVHLIKNHKIS